MHLKQKPEKVNKFKCYLILDKNIQTSRRVKSISDSFKKKSELNFEYIANQTADSNKPKEITFKIEDQKEYPKYLGYYFRKNYNQVISFSFYSLGI
jgi:hypothetical protein